MDSQIMNFEPHIEAYCHFGYLMYDWKNSKIQWIYKRAVCIHPSHISKQMSKINNSDFSEKLHLKAEQ